MTNDDDGDNEWYGGRGYRHHRGKTDNRKAKGIGKSSRSGSSDGTGYSSTLLEDPYDAKRILDVPFSDAIPRTPPRVPRKVTIDPRPPQLIQVSKHGLMDKGSPGSPPTRRPGASRPSTYQELSEQQNVAEWSREVEEGWPMDGRPSQPEPGQTAASSVSLVKRKCRRSATKHKDETRKESAKESRAARKIPLEAETQRRRLSACTCLDDSGQHNPLAST